MYRIAICDDQKEYLDMIDYTLHNYCRTYNISITLKSYDNSDTLVEEIENKKLFDAYILDIEMTPYSGIEIAKIIESYSSTACIVFLTAFSNYAMEACGMNIFRYVLIVDELAKDTTVAKAYQAWGEWQPQILITYSDLKAVGEPITPKKWRREVDTLTAKKYLQYQEMRAMREELKAV